MGTYPLQGPLTLARERLMVDRIAAVAGALPRLGVGLQWYALNSTATWSEADLRTFLAWLVARGVTEVDVFCATKLSSGEFPIPKWWWPALEWFVDAPHPSLATTELVS